MSITPSDVSENPFDVPVHPAADVFPMLPEDELAELANDISENGLLEPIVLQKINGATVLIDGRNRRAACEMVKVEPECVFLKDDIDPVSVILSANINRRHMTKGQRAMAVAKIYPEPAKLRRNGSSPLQNKELSGARVSQARTVLKHAPDRADAVLAGSLALNTAYEIAKQNKEAAQSFEARFNRIRETDQNLASLVTEEQITIEAAETELRERAKRDQERIHARNMGLSAIHLAANTIGNEKQAELYASFILNESDHFELPSKKPIQEFLSDVFALREAINKFCDLLEDKAQ